MEAAVTVAILALLISGAMTLFTQPFATERTDQTVAELLALKRAIVGDPRTVTREARTDFGFVGDVGSLPASLDELWIRGAMPRFAFDTTLKIGTGWAGPYVQVPPLALFDDAKRDAWGTEIQYTVATEVSAATGQTVRAKLTSYGPDAAPGGDDLTVEIYEHEMSSTLVGYIRDAKGNPLPGVTATTNFPVAAMTTSATIQTDVNGVYTFSNVPLGNRSLVLEPHLVYVQDTAFSSGGQDNDVEFVVQNYASNNVTINSITPLYDVNAFFERLRISNQTEFNVTVFDNSADRAGSGETISFADRAINGTGSIAGGTIPLRVQSGFTLTPDQNIGQVARKGGTMRVLMEDFVDAETGPASAVDMTGISFQVTFSDGSVGTFTTVRK